MTNRAISLNSHRRRRVISTKRYKTRARVLPYAPSYSRSPLRARSRGHRTRWVATTCPGTTTRDYASVRQVVSCSRRYYLPYTKERRRTDSFADDESITKLCPRDGRELRRGAGAARKTASVSPRRKSRRFSVRPRTVGRVISVRYCRCSVDKRRSTPVPL